MSIQKNQIINQSQSKKDCCPSSGGNPIPLHIESGTLQFITKKFNLTILFSIFWAVATITFILLPDVEISATRLIFMIFILVQISLVALLILLNFDISSQIVFHKRLWNQRIEIRLLQYLAFPIAVLSSHLKTHKPIVFFLAFSLIKTSR